MVNISQRIFVRLADVRVNWIISWLVEMAESGQTCSLRETADDGPRNGGHRLSRRLAAMVALGAVAAFVALPLRADEPRTIRVAAFDFYPCLFRDRDGEVKGAFVDMIRAVAGQQGWRVTYVYGNWADALDRLKAGEVDLVPCATLTEERAAFMDYSRESLLTAWGEVYVPSGSTTNSILQLDRRRIAIMRSDDNGASFRQLAESFGVRCTFRVVDDFRTVLELVDAGHVDAGVVNNAYGSTVASSFDVLGTGIVFNPSQVYFAVPRDTQADLLQVLDSALAAWKATPDSIYYRSLNRWTRGNLNVLPVVPPILRRSLFALAGMLLAALVFMAALRLRVRRATASLRESEQRLRDSESRFRQIAETVREVFWIGAPDFSQIDYVSPEFENVWGLSPQQVYENGAVWLDSIMPEDLPAVRAAMAAQRDLSSGELRYPDFRIRRPDGAILWVSARTYPAPGAAGQSSRVVGVAENITERVAVEDQQRQLAVALEHIAEGIIIANRDGRVLYANPASVRITGGPPREIVDWPPGVPPDKSHESAVDSELWSTVTTGKVWTGKFTNQGRDGDLVTIDMTVSPILGETGRIELFVAVQRDITDELKLESALLHAQRMEAVGCLAAGVAHDFNNLLTPIIGYAELIQQSPQPDPRLEEHTTMILNASERARDLTRQLLAFGRRQTLRISLLDLNLVVMDIRKLIQRTVREHVLVLVETAPYPCGVLADSGQLGQILINLAVNAQDAMPSGGTFHIRLDVCNSPSDEMKGLGGVKPGLYTRMVVSDTGCGMTAETRAKAFDPFYSTKGKAGTGLGLATVYGIVKQHDGHILLESTLGVGTTFTILLPYKDLSRGVRESLDPNETMQDLVGTECILLAEDDTPIRLLAGTLLRQAGYRVIATSGDDSPAQLIDRHASEIDLLLTDVIMPGMNGPELYAYLATLRPAVKVIYMSGYPDEVLSPHGILTPDFNFLQKPFHQQELLATVREVLDRD